MYASKISNAKWIAYDLPGNAGWISFPAALGMCFIQKPGINGDFSAGLGCRFHEWIDWSGVSRRNENGVSSMGNVGNILLKRNGPGPSSSGRLPSRAAGRTAIAAIKKENDK